MSTDTALITLIVATPVALLVAYSDLRTMTIPNRLSLAAAAIFAVLVFVTLPFDAALWRLAQGGILLAICFVFFSFGWIGGGDAKIAPAFALLIASRDVSPFLVILAFAALVSVVVISVLRASPLAAGPERGGWEVWSPAQNSLPFRKRHIPFGVALSAALLIYLALVLRISV